MKQLPDYARYSLDDLHDVARHIDKQRYPERYALVLQEIEKRESALASGHNEELSAETNTDGCLLTIVRYCGGMVLAILLPVGLALLALKVELPYNRRLAEFGEIGIIALPFVALAGGIYAAFRLQEARIATSSSPVAIRAVLGFLALLVRFCGGLFMAAIVALALWEFMFAGSRNSERAIILPVASVLGGMLAVWLPMGRKRRF